MKNIKLHRTLVQTIIASLFSFAILYLFTFQTTHNTFNVYAGTLEPVETTISSASATPKATVRPTVTPSAKASPTASTAASASPSATLIPVQSPAPIVNTVQSPTPVPTFNLNQPGQVAPQGSTAPAVQTQSTNNTPLIIGIVGGLLLIVGGVVIFVLRKNSSGGDSMGPVTPVMPPQTPPQQFNQNTNTPGGQQYSTPYDQYMNNQNKDQNK